MATNKYINNLVKKGNKCLTDKDWKKGCDIFNELNNLIPDNYPVLINLSACLTNSGNLKEAHEIISKLEKLTPLNIQVNYSRGCIYELEKKYDLALKSFKKCLKIDKDHIDSWIKCAIILRRSHKYQDAVGIYKHIIQKDPNNPDLIIDLCDTMYENNQKDESEKILKQLINHDPKNSNAKKVLARIYHNTPGKKEEAILLEKEAEGSITF